jgi:hypothetical protein
MEIVQGHTRGPMIQIIEEYFRNKPNVLCIIPCGDGNYMRHHIDSYIKRAQNHKPPQTLIVGTLGQCAEESTDVVHYLYLPLDDNFFANGVTYYFPVEQQKPWSQRIPKVYWRGGCSGVIDPVSPRVRTVGALMNYPHADVKLTRCWHVGKNIPEEYFGEYSTGEHHYHNTYKMFLIIDGNSIGSSHMWAFATGAVPLLITKTRCWFSRYLKPFWNYIPIQYDLSDIIEKIEWVLTHDQEAEQIAKNATAFVQTIFSSEHQRKYLTDVLDRIIEDPISPH